jgi:hypothetical protein
MEYPNLHNDRPQSFGEMLLGDCIGACGTLALEIEGGGRQKRPFPRIKEIFGLLQRYDFSAERAQSIFE